MTCQPGQEIELTIEKPAAGGRMIARHERRVVLVLGGIPGERVRARITRADRQLAFAEALDVLEPSSDRREAPFEAGCGGCLYAHIAYGRQVALKGEVLQDAFVRLGRIPVAAPVEVSPSPERGYRMRARLHARGGRAGFYREGTHDLCDPRQTGQLTDAAVAAAEAVVQLLTGGGHVVTSVELAENIAGDMRAIHVTVSSSPGPSPETLAQVAAAAGVRGLSARCAAGVLRSAGTPAVNDPLEALTRGRAAAGALERGAESFFQANRFLLPQLVECVLEAVPEAGGVLDLYAGVGLFSVSLAATGRADVTAVEGDRSSGGDLQRNAAAFANGLRVVMRSVEDYLRHVRSRRAATMIVDPPRTGISREAMDHLPRYGASRIVYVSCDPATMARDARRMLDGGYRLASLRGFDLFPNTPHVEAVAVFERT